MICARVSDAGVSAACGVPELPRAPSPAEADETAEATTTARDRRKPCHPDRAGGIMPRPADQ
jgi:hypothetical protein